MLFRYKQIITVKTLALLVHLILLTTSGHSVLVRLSNMECQMNKKFCSDPFCFLKTIRQRISLMNIGCNFILPIDHFTVKFSLERLMMNKYQTIFEYETDGCQILLGSAGSPVISRFLDIVKKHMNIPKTCPYQGNISITNCPLDFSIFPNIIPSGNFRASFKSFDVGKHKNETMMTLSVLAKI